MNFLNYRLFHVGKTDVTVSSLLLFVGILVATLIVARLARKVIAERLLARTHLEKGARYAIGRVAGYLVFFVGAMLALNMVGVDATSLAAFGAAVGVGLGFGLQDIVKNFVAGIIVLLERPVMVGDRIEIGEVVGDVIEIRTRSTVVRTNDDIYLIVPNAKFITETVTNWSFRNDRVRFRVPIGVSYRANPRDVEAALLEAAAQSTEVLKEPEPQVWFRGFGESSLDFDLLCWTRTMLHRRGAFRSDLNFRIHEALASRGIEIPYPQRDLHIRSAGPLEKNLAPPAPAGRAGERTAARKLQKAAMEENS
jgi:small-conductance mechanosensitive channel